MESIYQSIALPCLVPRRCAYVSIIHDASNHPGDEHWLKRVTRIFELRRADKFVTLSQYVSNKFSEASSIPRHEIATLFHPAYRLFADDLPHPGRSAPRGVPTIGVLGRLMAYKGIDIYLDALHVLATRGTSVNGHVAGDGPEKRLEATANGPLARWSVGWMSDLEMQDILKSFDVLAVTYREASQSGVIAHAMTLGIPVVATPVGGIVDQVEPWGIGVVSDDVTPEAVANAIERLVSDPAYYERCSLVAVAAARGEASWDRFAELLTAVLIDTRGDSR